MVMLSQLLRAGVADRKGSRARLDDLGLAVLDDDYPPVTSIYIVDSDGARRSLSWNEATAVGKGGVTVEDLDSANECPDEPPVGEVLLKADVMDALILDLLNRRTTRANDIDLEQEDGSLRLKGIDAGIGAMLRRITRGTYSRLDKENLYDWQYVEFLRGDPAAVRSGAGYRMRIGRLPAGEIARLADYIPYLHAAELLKLLQDEKAADVLQAMPIERQVQVIEELDDDEASQLLMRMSPDLAADLAGRLPVDVMTRWLRKMPKENSDRIVELLRYPESSVGGAMTNNIVFFAAGTTAGEARLGIAKVVEKIELIPVVFVVDNAHDRKLLGSVALRYLLGAEDNEPLESIMDPYLARLSPFDDAGDAARRLAGAQMAALPVVDGEGRLIGAMTINAAIARLLPTSGELGNLRVFS